MNSGTRHINSPDNVRFALYAAMSTFIAIQIMWRIMLFRKAATTQRGVKYGSLTGLLSLYMMVNMITFNYMLPLDNNVPAMSLIYTPIFMSVFAFISGGFLAPILGAIMGYFFTRNIGVDLENSM